MNLVSFEHLSKYNANSLILENISVNINDSNRYGLIGPNGSGKSTFINVLFSELQNDRSYEEGKVRISKEARIGIVPQFSDFGSSASCLEYLTEDYVELRKKLRVAEEDLNIEDPIKLEKALIKYQLVRDQWDERSGDQAEERAQKYLHKIGLGTKIHLSPEKLSGGEQRLLLLARALQERPNLLVLDEPDNHLDFAILLKLELELVQFSGAILLVSHNRYLLDRLCTHILELNSRSITTYPGNYSNYRLEKLKKMAAQQASYASDQRKIARLEKLVKYLQLLATARADPGTGARLRARRSHLRMAKEQATEKPSLDTSRFSLGLSQDVIKSDIALEVNSYHKSFGATEIIRKGSFIIHSGEKVGLLGANGSGKTSFIEDLLKEGDWNNYVLRLGPQMKLGYVPQHHTDEPSNQSLESYVRDFGALTKDQAFSLISPYGFSWDDMHKPFDNLSGGEKTRILFAKLVYQKANFLILDEPTNHMDIDSREALEDALQDYSGTLLVVSHDRYLLEKLVHRIIAIENKSFTSLDGGFSQYWRDFKEKMAAKEKKHSNGNKEGAGSGVEAQDLEKKIEAIEKELITLEKNIMQSINSGDHELARKKSRKLESLRKILNDLYEKWEKASL